MNFGAQKKFKQYEAEQKGKTIIDAEKVDDSTYRVALEAGYDPDIDGADIPKRFKEEYKQHVKTGFKWWGIRLRKPREMWQSEIDFNRRERAQAKAERQHKEQVAERNAAYEKYMDHETRSAALMEQGRVQWEAKHSAEKPLPDWLVMSVVLGFVTLCSVGVIVLFHVL